MTMVTTIPSTAMRLRRPTGWLAWIAINQAIPT